MSQPNAASPASQGVANPPVPTMPVTAAIARAASATGVDFQYLLAQARLESGLDPQARARNSSASGLYQFTRSTWLTTLGRHGVEAGLDPAALSAAASDPSARAQLLAMRQDPALSALMAGDLANDNRAFLSGQLGREPDNAELYLAHFLGPDGASQFLSALSTNPSQSAAALLPRAAAANRSIFFSGTAPRSVGQVMDLLRHRLDGAMAGTTPVDPAGAGSYWPTDGTIAPPQPVAHGGPIAQEFAAAADQAGLVPTGSMADTLRTAFGLADETAAVPANVRAAYSQMRALGL